MSVKCSVHESCKAMVKIDGVSVCYECWNRGSQEERAWIKKAVELYNKGFLTKDDLQSYLTSIAFHQIDPTFPVHLE